MSDRKIQITITVSDDEASAIFSMAEADRASMIEAVTASIRQELIERSFIRTDTQVIESNSQKLLRFDEVMGNTILDKEK